MADKSGCLIFVILIITGIIAIIIGVSIHTVPLNQVAIIQNKFNKQIDDTKIYKNGRYFIGPTSK